MLTYLFCPLSKPVSPLGNAKVCLLIEISTRSGRGGEGARVREVTLTIFPDSDLLMSTFLLVENSLTIHGFMAKSIAVLNHSPPRPFFPSPTQSSDLQQFFNPSIVALGSEDEKM